MPAIAGFNLHCAEADGIPCLSNVLLPLQQFNTEGAVFGGTLTISSRSGKSGPFVSKTGQSSHLRWPILFISAEIAAA